MARESSEGIADFHRHSITGVMTTGGAPVAAAIPCPSRVKGFASRGSNHDPTPPKLTT